ncbi:MAG TPA: hypothetical protein VJJ24_00770 [Candidatus Paceibacterota bacterium]
MSLRIRAIFYVAIVLALSVFFVSEIGSAQTSCDVDPNGKSNAELEEVVAKCEAEIAAHREDLKVVQGQSRTLETGIKELNSKITQSALEIKRRNLKIAQLRDEISLKESTVTELLDKMERIKESLGELVRESNELDERSSVEAVLSAGDISDFFIDVDSFGVVKGKLYERLKEIQEIKIKTEEAKASLLVSRTKEEEQKFLREKEKRQTEGLKGEKQRVLTVTKAEEKTYQQIIAEKEAKKQAILARILNIGTTEITFGAALKLIQPYESQLGVDSALVLSVLTQESGVEGVIGKNLGKCTYNQSAQNTNGTVMSPTQIPAFLVMASELGIDPDKTPVSCPIYQDGAYGGAMGPSQFMPLTWSGFKSRISSIVGASAVSPFVNQHAFVGTMLYLSDAMTRCRTAFTSQHDLWSCAAAKYYSGLASTGSRLALHMKGYGARVATRAEQFQADIDFLNL